MPDMDIRNRLEAVARPAFATPVDAAADLARGRRGRRRRRIRQVAAGTSAGALAGAVAVAGLPLLPGGAGSSNPAGTPDGADQPSLMWRLGSAVDQHVGLNGEDVPSTKPGTYLYATMLDGSAHARAELYIWIHDAAREDNEPVPKQCEDVPDYYDPIRHRDGTKHEFGYDTCERRTLPDGSSVVVGEGAQDLLVVRWGPGGDLIELIAQWGPGEPHDVTLDGMLALSGDERVQIRQDDPVAAPDPR